MLSQFGRREEGTSSSSSSSWSWGGLITKPVSWLLFSGNNETTISTNERLVAVTVAKEKAEQIYKDLSENFLYQTDKLITEEEVMEKQSLKPEDVNIVFTALKIIKKGIPFTVNDLNAMKLGSHKMEDVTEVDRGIIQIKNTIQLLNKHIQNLEDKIKIETKKAIEKNKSNQKSQALRIMKNRKRIILTVESRLQARDTLSEIFDQIQNAESTNDILQNYKIGSQTLKSLKDKYKLTAEKVEDDNV